MVQQGRRRNLIDDQRDSEPNLVDDQRLRLHNCSDHTPRTCRSRVSLALLTSSAVSSANLADNVRSLATLGRSLIEAGPSSAKFGQLLSKQIHPTWPKLARFDSWLAKVGRIRMNASQTVPELVQIGRGDLTKIRSRLHLFPPNWRSWSKSGASVGENYPAGICCLPMRAAQFSWPYRFQETLCIKSASRACIRTANS